MPEFFFSWTQKGYMSKVTRPPYGRGETRIPPPPHTCTHLGLSLPGALLNCCSEAHRDQVNSLNKNFFFDGIVFVHDVLKSCPVRGLTSSILCHCSIHYCCFEMVAQCVALGALELSSAHQCRPCWPWTWNGPTASVCQMLGFQAWTTTPCLFV